MATIIPRKNVKMGHIFTIILPENESTGYSWHSEVTCGLKIIKDEYESNERKGEMGKRIWTIKATKKGLQDFTAYYQRSWDPEYAGEYHCVVRVF